MSHPAISISEDAEIEDAASLMLSHRIARLPVVRDGRLIGSLPGQTSSGESEGQQDDRSIGVKSICAVEGVSAWGIKEGNAAWH